jgi:uncharacterized protein YdhG (YjbR/CyaY superfamily)
MATRMNTAIKTTDEYIAGFPKATQVLLEKIRAIIKKAAPKATEVISYGIPTFVLGKNLVHFGGYKTHIGFYPGAAGVEAFKKEIAGYTSSKGAIQFPLDKPLPAGLITQIVKFRVLQNLEKAAGKKAIAKPIKVKKTPDDEQVKAWMDKLAPTLKGEINAVRKIIKLAAPELSERIKWNAPSYYYREDIVTFGPSKNNKILLVFHHPAVVNVKSALLEGQYKDRRLVYFNNKKEAAKNKQELSRIIQAIIQSINKK